VNRKHTTVDHELNRSAVCDCTEYSTTLVQVSWSWLLEWILDAARRLIHWNDLVHHEISEPHRVLTTGNPDIQ